jgi:hypothetical protein
METLSYIWIHLSEVWIIHRLRQLRRKLPKGKRPAGDYAVLLWAKESCISGAFARAALTLSCFACLNNNLAERAPPQMRESLRHLRERIGGVDDRPDNLRVGHR